MAASIEQEADGPSQGVNDLNWSWSRCAANVQGVGFVSDALHRWSITDRDSCFSRPSMVGTLGHDRMCPSISGPDRLMGDSIHSMYGQSRVSGFNMGVLLKQQSSTAGYCMVPAPLSTADFRISKPSWVSEDNPSVDSGLTWTEELRLMMQSKCSHRSSSDKVPQFPLQVTQAPLDWEQVDEADNLQPIMSAFPGRLEAEPSCALAAVDSGSAELGEELGRGATSVVYKGRWADRDVAVKVNNADGLEPALAELEASIAMGLEHPHIVATLHRYVMTTYAPASLDTRYNHSLSVPSLTTLASDSRGWRLGSAITSSISSLATKVCQSLSHPGPASSTTWHTQHLVMEWCAGGSLRSLLNHSPQVMSDMQQMLPLAWQLCSAVEYLHSCSIVHGDIKADNVLLVPWPYGQVEATGCLYSARLADFGCAIRYLDTPPNSSGTLTASSASAFTQLKSHGRFDRTSSSVQSSLNVATPTHLAPEVLFGTSPKAPSTDVYALGVTIWEVITGSKAYHKMRTADLWQSKTQATSAILRFPPQTNSGLVEFCHACWHRVPEERPTAEQLRMRIENLIAHVAAAES